MSWLAEDEWRHVALTSRLRKSGGTARFGQAADGRLWIRHEGGEVNGGLYLSRYGVVLPAFDRKKEASTDTDFLQKVLRPRMDRLFSIIGMEDRVLELEQNIGSPPPDFESYRMFTGEILPENAGGTPEDMTLHRAVPSDLDRLWDLEKAYLREEVLRAGSRMDERAGRRHFLGTLKEQEVYYAALGNRIVAKAGTNARGVKYDQIGGVFVIPELRGCGFARIVMNRLLESITAADRRACLFVKTSNVPALKLYEKLGFSDRGPFRISYWS
jgi:ribosomal protein S18 acetylase RimI-like enzyme